MILELLQKEVYFPLFDAFPQREFKFKNSVSEVLEAIKTGRIWYSDGKFSGRFNATLSRELRHYGAVWDRRQGCFSIPQSALPDSLVTMIRFAKLRSDEAFTRVAEKLDAIEPAKVAGKFKAEKQIEMTAEELQERIDESTALITVVPKLTKDDLGRIASEYEQNLQIEIQDWTEKETQALRARVMEVAAKGGRYEQLAEEIEFSYGVSAAKAKFLARQEMSLLMVKMQQIRYEAAGCPSYRWKCAAGSPNHPVREMHKMHDGKVFFWRKPPVVNQKGDRKNPGQDYNCRCVAIPIVEF